ncbi:MAG: tetraacyldisaccharide 4'-kinase [Thermodesulfovibrionales bacterium]|nr:tetraacyldisaccharide 4'-kinase [Thermodesulfovibrionales bacterium]
MTLPEFIYYIGYSLDKRYKLKRQQRLPHTVISIGNVTIGGTGKTPATIDVAEEAKKRGFSPIILTRGYKGNAKGPCLVQRSEVRSQKSEGKSSKQDSSLLFGDEPVLMADRLKDVPIVKCADRYEGAMFFLQNYEPSAMNYEPIFILDDGFQHWRLYRDMDIVLIDGSNPFGNRRLLPVGPLREPLSELKRAGMFVITKTKNESLINELKGFNSAAPVYFSEYEIRRLKNASGKEFPVEVLKHKRVYAFCGLANPESFKQTALSVCGELSGFKAYRDHHSYTISDMRYLEEQSKKTECDFLLTTEKDMVKIKGMNIPENLLCVEIDFSIDRGFFDSVFKNIS